MSSISYCLHKLAVHVINQSLHVLALGRSQFAGRVAGVLKFAYLEDLGLQFRPAHEIAVVDPFRNHADRAHYAAAIGINLIRGGRDVICATGADRLDGSHNAFVFLIPDPLDFAINLF